MFNHIPIYIRHPDGVYLVQCLQSYEDGLFYVQSADFFANDADVNKLVLESQARLIELLIDSAPAERMIGQKTIEAAVDFFFASSNARENPEYK